MTDWSTEDRRRFWTVAQVAAHWCVSDDKVRASIRKGGLAAYATTDGTLRIRERDALEYLMPYVVSHVTHRST